MTSPDSHHHPVRQGFAGGATIGAAALLLVVGIIAILIAFGMFVGATWARVSAVIIASLSIIANFLWIPYFPWWSILIIAVDLVVIWAVCTWQTD